FYAARSSSMPPLPWPNFSPPFSMISTGSTRVKKVWATFTKAFSRRMPRTRNQALASISRPAP
ncbi:hypothetical protein, partial [Paracoccus fontiphilus]